MALNVGNHVSNDADLPTNAAFGDISGDDDNFRLEVEDAMPSPSLTREAELLVGHCVHPIRYVLIPGPGNRYRSQFIRLVTDGPDDAVVGDQTVIGALGDEVVMRYSRAPGCRDKHSIRIGRPVSENNNGSDQLLHDIRELKVNVVVFSRPGQTALANAINATQTTIPVNSVAGAHQAGTIRIDSGALTGVEFVDYNGIDTQTNEFLNCTRGQHGSTAAPHGAGADVLYSLTTPAVTRAQADADLTTIDERFAQATIRLVRPVPINMGGQGDPGVVLPPQMLVNFAASLLPFNSPSPAETAIVLYKDSDINSIDVFYVNQITRPGVGQFAGLAYYVSKNGTGNALYQNFLLVSADFGRPMTAAHEVMHIVLNSGHRLGEPATALFRSPTSATKAVTGTKRIGPYPDAKSAGVGNGDTQTIRPNIETLPS